MGTTSSFYGSLFVLVPCAGYSQMEAVQTVALPDVDLLYILAGTLVQTYYLTGIYLLAVTLTCRAV